MNTRALVLGTCLATSLLVCTPAALASPRADHDDHRHQSMTSWAAYDRDGRGDSHRDSVWNRYDRDDDSWGEDSDGDSDSSDDADSDDSDTSDSGTGDTGDSTETGKQAVASGAALSGAAQSVQVETTSYNFADNSGSNNATICCPKLHKTAGGDGSYQNPITLAVPGSGGSGMQTPAGTRVYFEKYRFYGIVEDSGASPKSLRRFDIWSDGRGLSESAGSACMDALTGQSAAILNAPPGKPVAHVGPLADASGCHVPGGD
jgi:hypothetical protein